MEDSPEVREVFALFLPTLGHWVESAGEASTALERLCQGGFDVLLTNLWQPDARGWCLLHELRARGHLPPHVVSTGASIPSDATELSRAAGCCAHLVSPFRHSGIEQTLQAICRAKNAPQATRPRTAEEVRTELFHSALHDKGLQLRTESRLLCAVVARNIALCGQAVDEARRTYAESRRKRSS